MVEEPEQSPAGSPKHFTSAQLSGENNEIRLFLAVNKADNTLQGPRAWISWRLPSMLCLLTCQGMKAPSGEQKGVLLKILKAEVGKSWRDQKQRTAVVAVSCSQGRGAASSAWHTGGVSTLEASESCIGFARFLATEKKMWETQCDLEPKEEVTRMKSNKVRKTPLT